MKSQYQLNSQRIENGLLVSQLNLAHVYHLVPTDVIEGPAEDVVDIDAEPATSTGQYVELLPPDSNYTENNAPGEGVWTAKGGIDVGRKYWLAEYDNALDTYNPVKGWPNYSFPVGSPPIIDFIGIVGTRQGAVQYTTSELGYNSNTLDAADTLPSLFSGMTGGETLIIDNVVPINGNLLLTATDQVTLKFVGQGKFLLAENVYIRFNLREGKGIRLIADRTQIFQSTTGTIPDVRGDLGCDAIYPEWFGSGVDQDVDLGQVLNFIIAADQVVSPRAVSFRGGDMYKINTTISIQENDWALICDSGSRYGGVTLRHSTGRTILSAQGPTGGLVSHFRAKGIKFQGIGDPGGSEQEFPVVDTSNFDSSTFETCGIVFPGKGWAHNGSGGAITWMNCFFVQSTGLSGADFYLIDAGGPPTMIGCQIENGSITIRGGRDKSADFIACHIENCGSIDIVEGRAEFIGGKITESIVVFGPGTFHGFVKVHSGSYKVLDFGHLNTVQNELFKSAPASVRSSEVVHNALRGSAASMLLDADGVYLLSIGFDLQSSAFPAQVSIDIVDNEDVLVGPANGLTPASGPLSYGPFDSFPQNTVLGFQWRQIYDVLQVLPRPIQLKLAQNTTVCRASIPLNPNPLCQRSSSTTLTGYTTTADSGIAITDSTTGRGSLIVRTHVLPGGWSIFHGLNLDISKTYHLVARVSVVDFAPPVFSVFGTPTNPGVYTITSAGHSIGLDSSGNDVVMYSFVFSPSNSNSGDGHCVFGFGAYSGTQVNFNLEWIAIVELGPRTEYVTTSEDFPTAGTYLNRERVRYLNPTSAESGAVSIAPAGSDDATDYYLAATQEPDLNSNTVVSKHLWYCYKDFVYIAKTDQLAAPISLPTGSDSDPFWRPVRQPESTVQMKKTTFKSFT